MDQLAAALLYSKSTLYISSARGQRGTRAGRWSPACRRRACGRRGAGPSGRASGRRRPGRPSSSWGPPGSRRGQSGSWFRLRMCKPGHAEVGVFRQLCIPHVHLYLPMLSQLLLDLKIKALSMKCSTHWTTFRVQSRARKFRIIKATWSNYGLI